MNGSEAPGLDRLREAKLPMCGRIVGRPESTLVIDGAHARVLRPPDSAERKAKYSGKKRFASYTNVMTALRGPMVFQGRSADGSKHDFTLSKGDMPDFTPWENARTGATRDKPPATLLGDEGFQGMEKASRGNHGHAAAQAQTRRNGPDLG